MRVNERVYICSFERFVCANVFDPFFVVFSVESSTGVGIFSGQIPINYGKPFNMNIMKRHDRETELFEMWIFM